jgi:hypothetical protein
MFRMILLAAMFAVSVTALARLRAPLGPLALEPAQAKRPSMRHTTIANTDEPDPASSQRGLKARAAVAEFGASAGATRALESRTLRRVARA